MQHKVLYNLKYPDPSHTHSVFIHRNAFTHSRKPTLVLIWLGTEDPGEKSYAGPPMRKSLELESRIKSTLKVVRVRINT